jgi:hypothetical protein
MHIPHKILNIFLYFCNYSTEISNFNEKKRLYMENITKKHFLYTKKIVVIVNPHKHLKPSNIT